MYTVTIYYMFCLHLHNTIFIDSMLIHILIQLHNAESNPIGCELM